MSRIIEWPVFVPAAKRRAQAQRQVATLSRKQSAPASPIRLASHKITSTFWGNAWCKHLEAYGDYANRLPRGRSYVRNGSVVDLQIRKGEIIARVSGSSLYRIAIKIQPLKATLWKSIQTECAGKIDSLIELLQGKLSASVMRIVTHREQGLFPAPHEIELDCSCPDSAYLCKHLAASLYGVGSRLDQNPELLFLLRGVDPADLSNQASAAEAVRQTTASSGIPVLTHEELTDVFGIELAEAPISAAPTPKAPKIGKRKLSSAERSRRAKAKRLEKNS